MDVYIERSKKSLSRNFSGEAKLLLDSLDILSEDVLIIKNGVLVTDDELLVDSDSIRLLSVVSGG